MIPLDRLLLGHGALARALPRARVGPRPLPARRQVPAVAQAAVAADLHQALDVHRDLLAEIALDATLLLEHAADLADVLFRQVLDADVGTHARRAQHVGRSLASNAVDIGEPDLDPLGPREINTGYARHTLLASPFSLPGSCSRSVRVSRVRGSNHVEPGREPVTRDRAA